MVAAAVVAASVAACGSSPTQPSTSSQATASRAAASPVNVPLGDQPSGTVTLSWDPQTKNVTAKLQMVRLHPRQQSRDACPPGQLRGTGGCPGPVSRRDRQRRWGDRHHRHQLAAIRGRSRRRDVPEHPSGSGRAAGGPWVAGVHAHLLCGHHPCRIDGGDDGAAAPARPAPSGLGEVDLRSRRRRRCRSPPPRAASSPGAPTRYISTSARAPLRGRSSTHSTIWWPRRPVPPRRPQSSRMSNQAPPASGWYVNVHLGSSSQIQQNGQPTLYFQPIICGNIGK